MKWLVCISVFVFWISGVYVGVLGLDSSLRWMAILADGTNGNYKKKLVTIAQPDVLCMALCLSTPSQVWFFWLTYTSYQRPYFSCIQTVKVGTFGFFDQTE